MPTKFCHSCGMPLDVPGFKSSVENFCTHCVDDAGEVVSYEEALAGITRWFLMWQPGVSERAAGERARKYLEAMPHWSTIE